MPPYTNKWTRERGDMPPAAKGALRGHGPARWWRREYVGSLGVLIDPPGSARAVPPVSSDEKAVANAGKRAHALQYFKAASVWGLCER